MSFEIQMLVTDMLVQDTIALSWPKGSETLLLNHVGIHGKEKGQFLVQRRIRPTEDRFVIHFHLMSPRKIAAISCSNVYEQSSRNKKDGGTLVFRKNEGLPQFSQTHGVPNY